MTDRPLRKGDIVTDEHGHILRVLDPTFDHTDEGHVAMVESEVDKERFRIPVTDLVLPDEVGPPWNDRPKWPCDEIKAVQAALGGES